MWNNGVEWVRLGARVNADDQMVRFYTTRIGRYKVKEVSQVTELTLFKVYPRIITPNGDGLNDYFKIAENIGNVELIIINRWGNEEYRNRNYLNDWEGQNNKGEKLPNDTYFYILIFENDTVKKGSVLIKK